jgi:tetratricopeptide (TPR) repeat protein
MVGVVRFYRWQWSPAEESFKRALELNPGYAPGHSWYALHLAARGRLGEAIGRMYRAREFDPLSPHISQNLGWVLHYARQYDEEIEQYQRTFELDPDFLFARSRLIGAYLEKRMFNEAISECQRTIELSGRNPRQLGDLAESYALSGMKNEARQILKELMKLREHRYVNPYTLAIINVRLDLKEQAFRWLEQCYQERSYAMVYLKVSQELDPIRSDPRFRDLLRRVGLAH